MSKRTKQLALARDYWNKRELSQALKYYRQVGIDNLDHDEQINVADMLYNVGESEEAFNLINKVIEQRESVLAYERRAHFYRKNGDFELAFLDLNRAIELNPDDYYQHWYTRGMLYLDQDMYEEAIHDYDKALQRCKTERISFIYYGKGVALMRMGDFETATSILKSAITNPDMVLPLFYYDLSRALQELNKTDEAIHYLKQAQELLSFFENQSDRGKALYYQRCSCAAQAIESVWDIEKETYHYHLPLAILYSKQKNYEEALFELEKAEAILPVDIYLLIQKAVILLMMNKQDDANGVIKQAIPLDEENTYEKLLDEIYALHNEHGQTDEALFLLSVVIEETQVAYAYAQRAEILRNIDQDAQAIDDYNEAIRLNPDKFLYWYCRGLAYQYLGEYEKAIADFEETIKREDENSKSSTYYEIGLTYLEMEEYEEAVRIFQIITKDVNQALPHYYLKLALALEELGEIEKALIALQKGKELHTYINSTPDQGESIYHERANYSTEAIKSFQSTIRKQLDFCLPMAKLYRQLELWSAAKEALDQGMSVDEEVEELYYEMVRLHRAQGDEEQALQAMIMFHEKLPPTPVSLYWLANAYQRLERYDEALYHNAKLIEMEDDDEVNYLQRGNILEDKHQYEDAIEAYTSAIQINETGDLRMKRSHAYYKLGQYDDALKDLQGAIQLDTDLGESANYRLALGQVYFAKEVWDLAAAEFSAAIDLDPEDTWLYTRLAEVYINKEDYEKAEATLVRALEIQPEIESPYYELAKFYRDQQKHEQTIEILTKLHESFSPSPTSFFWLAEAYHRLERYDEAININDKLLEIEDDDNLNFVQRGMIFVDSGEFQAAEEAYSQAIHLKETGDIYMKRSYARYILGEFENAMQDLNKAVELEPELNNVDYYHIALGRVFYAMELWELAGQAFTEALQIDPYNSWLHEQRANCKMHLEEYELAIEDCTNGIKIDPLNSSLFWLRGYLYYITGQYHEALNDALEYVKLMPDNVNSHYNLGLIYVRLEQYDEALEAFNQSLSIDSKHDSTYLERAYIYYHLFELELAINDLVQWVLYVDPDLSLEEQLEKIEELEGFDEQILEEVSNRLKDLYQISTPSNLLN